MKKVVTIIAPHLHERKIRGLGDAVAVVAQPVAAAIDAVAGTSIKTCGGCAKRRAALNKAVPFGQPQMQPPARQENQ